MRLSDKARADLIRTMTTALSGKRDEERAAYLVDMADDLLDRMESKDHENRVTLLALCFDEFGAQPTAAYRLKQERADDDGA